MPFAQGSRSGISYVPEVTFGTTPASPAMVAIPYNSHSINLTKERMQSGAIIPDRMMRNDRHGNRQVGGELMVEFCGDDFDPFLESVMMNTWATNVLKVGSTLKSFTLEDGALDISQFRTFTGCVASSMSLSVKPNQIVTSTFNFIGKDMTVLGTSLDPAKTAASGQAPFDSCTGSIAIANAGSAPVATAVITGIDLTIDNGMGPTFVVGSCVTPQLEFGMAQVSGTLTAYFENLDLYNRFLNETATAISFTLTDPGAVNSYTFLIPRAKINSGDIPVSGQTSRIMTVNFSSIYDATENTVLKITRT